MTNVGNPFIIVPLIISSLILSVLLSLIFFKESDILSPAVLNRTKKETFRIVNIIFIIISILTLISVSAYYINYLISKEEKKAPRNEKMYRYIFLIASLFFSVAYLTFVGFSIDINLFNKFLTTADTVVVYGILSLGALALLLICVETVLIYHDNFKVKNSGETNDETPRRVKAFTDEEVENLTNEEILKLPEAQLKALTRQQRKFLFDRARRTELKLRNNIAATSQTKKMNFKLK